MGSDGLVRGSDGFFGGNEGCVIGGECRVVGSGDRVGEGRVEGGRSRAGVSDVGDGGIAVGSGHSNACGQEREEDSPEQHCWLVLRRLGMAVLEGGTEGGEQKGGTL